MVKLVCLLKRRSSSGLLHSLRAKDVGADLRVNLSGSLIALGVSCHYHDHVAVDLGVQLRKLFVLASGLKLRQCFLLNGTRFVNKLGVCRFLFRHDGKCFRLALFQLGGVLLGLLCAHCAGIKAHVRHHLVSKIGASNTGCKPRRWDGDIAADRHGLLKLLTQPRKHVVHFLIGQCRLPKHVRHFLSVNVDCFCPGSLSLGSNEPFVCIGVTTAHLAVDHVLVEILKERLRPVGCIRPGLIDIELRRRASCANDRHSHCRLQCRVHQTVGNLFPTFRACKTRFKVRTVVPGNLIARNGDDFL